MHNLRLSQIGANDEYVPKEAKPLPISSSLPLFVLMAEAKCLDWGRNYSITHTGDSGDLNAKDAELSDAESDNANSEHVSSFNEYDEEEQED